MISSGTETNKLLALINALEQERSSWEDTWREIRDYIYPHSALALDEYDGSVKGYKRYSKVLDSYPEKAVRVLAAGMLGGMISPARMWFQLGLKGIDSSRLSAQGREWLRYVRDILMFFFNQSDIYGAMHQLFREMILYGQGVLLIENDPVNGFNFTPLSCGEYYLDQNDKEEVDILVRRIYYSARQMIERFGSAALDEDVLTAADNMQVERKYEVLHIIRPNRGRGTFSQSEPAVSAEEGFFPELTDNMEWESIYLLRSGGSGCRILRWSGFHEKPFVAPRWERVKGTPYGHSPARTALADVKTLYEIDKQNLTILKKNAAPPVTVKGSMKNQLIDLSPNGVTYVPAMNADAGVSPIYQPQNSFQMTESKIEKLQQSIREVFYNDLFMPVLQKDKKMSATEINSINSEKIGNITPVVERLEKEALDHIFRRCYSILDDFGDIIPPQPPELQGVRFDIDYISILAQSQKLSELGSIEQFVEFTAHCNGLSPQAGDKVNVEQVIQKYAEVLSIDNELLNTAEAIAQMQSKREEQIEEEKTSKEMTKLAPSVIKALTSVEPEKLQVILQMLVQGLPAMQKILNGSSSVVEGGLPVGGDLSVANLQGPAEESLSLSPVAEGGLLAGGDLSVANPQGSAGESLSLSPVAEGGLLAGGSGFSGGESSEQIKNSSDSILGGDVLR